MNRKIQISALTFLIVLISVSCTTAQQTHDTVASALNTYQIGKTTLADLKNDTGMVLVEIPAQPDLPHKSYLNHLPTFLSMLGRMTYVLPSGSKWKIYARHENIMDLNGKSEIAWAFLIGNTNKPICYLEFDFANVLTNIISAQNYVPPAQPKITPIMVQPGGIASASDSSSQLDRASAQTAPTPTNIEVVVQTLQMYQCNKTTIQDFARDAKLINLSHPEFNSMVMNSNLPSMTLEYMIRSSYQIPKGSPWKVYEIGKISIGGAGGFSFKHRWKYVVGDINKPIYILTFDDEGTLKEKTPITP